MTIDYRYEVIYLPTKKHRNERRIYFHDTINVEIQKMKEEEFPLAFEVTKKEYVVKDAKGHADLFEDAKYQLFTQKIRSYNGELYKEVFINCGSTISTLHEIPETYIKRQLERSSIGFTFPQNSLYNEGVSVIRYSDKEERQAEIHEKANSYKIFDGIVWEKCGEPYYVYYKTLTSFVIAIRYSDTRNLNKFEYSALEKNALAEELKKIEIPLCWDCDIKVFEPSLVKNHKPKYLNVSVTYKVQCEKKIPLPQNFTGSVEEALEYAKYIDISSDEFTLVSDSREYNMDNCYIS